ncbi:hypothetical protein E2986_08382 [Frieseomelitta varia]|uniref:Uncharacterized protein n=1 Tax=Frieseomelitta varia TaxID=561572 RepID=A0A833S260_9HYME|nr:hypothetical protein E2986_08382 [Frieseomelitta varia]
MFRDGQYLEVIKASNNCLVTVVVTVQEKTIKIKEKNVSTNKWLEVEDWVALYKILEKAISRNVQTEGSLQNFKKCKCKKSTRQLEVTYTFEPSESIKDVTSLPTIRVNVSPAKKRLEKSELPKVATEKKEILNQVIEKPAKNTFNHACQKKDIKNALPKKSGNDDLVTIELVDMKNDRVKRCLATDSLGNDMLEEYVPNAPVTKKLCANLNYIPSRKSTLEQTQGFSDEYSPTVSNNKNVADVVRYVPNSVNFSKVSYETYEPSGAAIANHPEEYIPNSKGIKASIEEYHPDFTSKTMKFDDSYVPSTVEVINENSKKLLNEYQKSHSEKYVLSMD